MIIRNAVDGIPEHRNCVFEVTQPPEVLEASSEGGGEVANTTFFPFGTGTGGVGGSGRCFQPGPPKGALGGPPMLMIGGRLFLGMNGCPKSVLTIGKAPPSGVMGMAVSGGKAGKYAMLEWPLWCWYVGRPGAFGG